MYTNITLNLPSHENYFCFYPSNYRESKENLNYLIKKEMR